MENQNCCEDWEPQLKKINSFIVLQAVRSGNYNIYNGKPFVYCPWCGKKKEDNKKEN